MLERELEGIVVDVCTFGHGIWFDDGELAAVVSTVPAARMKPSELRNQLDGKYDANSDEPERFGGKAPKCPVCERDTQPVNYDEWSGVTVDVCEHGVWVEQGELDRIKAWHSAKDRQNMEAAGDTSNAPVIAGDAHSDALRLQSSVRTEHPSASDSMISSLIRLFRS